MSKELSIKFQDLAIGMASSTEEAIRRVRNSKAAYWVYGVNEFTKLEARKVKHGKEEVWEVTYAPFYPVCVRPKMYVAHDDTPEHGSASTAIYGIGSSPELAVADALEQSPELEGLATCEASPELIDQVRDQGGNIPWDYDEDGRAIPV